LPNGFINKNEYAFYDNYRSGWQRPGFLHASMGEKIIIRYGYGFAGPKHIQVLNEKRIVEGVRMVVIEQLSLFNWHIGMVLVVAVVVDDGDFIGGESSRNISGYSAFARTGATGDTHKDR
jgi:hypothetical protein